MISSLLWEGEVATPDGHLRLLRIKLMPERRVATKPGTVEKLPAE